MRREITALAALLVLVAACDARSTGVSGRVTTFDGSPVGNVTVHVRAGDEGWSALCAADGTFSVPVPDGATARVWTESDTLPSLMLKVPAAPAADVELRFPELHSVSGTLVDTAGAPLAGRKVTLSPTCLDVEGPGGARVAAVGGVAITAADGTFRIDGLLAGPYGLDVPGDTPAGAPHLYCATEIVAAGAQGLRLVATTDAGVTGVVLGPSGEPVPARVSVSVREVPLPDGAAAIRLFVPGTHADAGGHFELTGLPPRRTTITAAYEGAVTTTVEVEPPVRDLQIRLAPLE